jgi:hypothetical protein
MRRVILKGAARSKILFVSLIIVQAAGAQIILWTGLPLYRRLLSGSHDGPSTKELALALFAIAIIQAGHWISLRMRPRLQFRRKSILGHFLIFFGELSLFFSSALAIAVVFDREGELEFVFWKILILAAILFSICCYKYQLVSLGTQLIEGEQGGANSRLAPRTGFE